MKLGKDYLDLLERDANDASFIAGSTGSEKQGLWSLNEDINSIFYDTLKKIDIAQTLGYQPAFLYDYDLRVEFMKNNLLFESTDNLGGKELRNKYFSYLFKSDESTELRLANPNIEVFDKTLLIIKEISMHPISQGNRYFELVRGYLYDSVIASYNVSMLFLVKEHLTNKKNRNKQFNMMFFRLFSTLGFMHQMVNDCKDPFKEYKGSDALIDFENSELTVVTNQIFNQIEKKYFSSGQARRDLLNGDEEPRDFTFKKYKIGNIVYDLFEECLHRVDSKIISMPSDEVMNSIDKVTDVKNLTRDQLIDLYNFGGSIFQENSVTNDDLEIAKTQLRLIRKIKDKLLNHLSFFDIRIPGKNKILDLWIEKYSSGIEEKDGKRFINKDKIKNDYPNEASHPKIFLYNFVIESKDLKALTSKIKVFNEKIQSGKIPNQQAIEAKHIDDYIRSGTIKITDSDFIKGGVFELCKGLMNGEICSDKGKGASIYFYFKRGFAIGDEQKGSIFNDRLNVTQKLELETLANNLIKKRQR